jgi:hypothetical protein
MKLKYLSIAIQFIGAGIVYFGLQSGLHWETVAYSMAWMALGTVVWMSGMVWLDACVERSTLS